MSDSQLIKICQLMEEKTDDEIVDEINWYVVDITELSFIYKPTIII